jgi:hypothetical protein
VVGKAADHDFGRQAAIVTKRPQRVERRGFQAISWPLAGRTAIDFDSV